MIEGDIQRYLPDIKQKLNNFKLIKMGPDFSPNLKMK